MTHTTPSNETAPETIPKAFKDAIRAEAISQVAKWVIGAFVILFGIAASGWWFYLQQKLNEYIAAKAGGVPPNAIIAIDDRRGCAALGDNWEDPSFDGKFIIGAKTNHKLWGYGQSGGQPTVTLTAEHMPQIYIGADSFLIGNNLSRSAVRSIGFIQPSPPYLAGGNANPKAIDILPPYISLFLCRKKP